MSVFLYENDRSRPTLTLLSVLGGLDVLNALFVRNVLNVLNTPEDASLGLVSAAPSGCFELLARITVHRKKPCVF